MKMRAFIWENRKKERVAHIKNSSLAKTNDLTVEEYSSSFEEVLSKVPDNVNIILCHYSNDISKGSWKVFLESLSTNFKEAQVILYSAGKLNIDLSGTILLDGTHFPGEWLVNRNLHFVLIEPGISGFKLFLNRLTDIEAIESERESCFSLHMFGELTTSLKRRFLILTDKLIVGYDFSKKGSRCITWLDFGNIKLEEFEAIIIDIEMRNSISNFHQNLGIELGIAIRNGTDYLGPIVFLTDAPRKYLIQNLGDCRQKNILKARGSIVVNTQGFKPKQITNQILKSLEMEFPLATPTLMDMRKMLLDTNGFFIDIITHSVNLTVERKKLDWAFEQLKDSTILKSFLGHKKIQAIEAYEQNDKTKLKQIKTDLITHFEQSILKSSEKNKQNTGDKNKIIFIEDNSLIKKAVSKALSPNFHIECFDDCISALKRLHEDCEKFEILCILADWRLYEKSSELGIWQKMQGYELLIAASKFHLASLVSLTSEQDSNVHEIRNYLGIDVFVFKKEYLDFTNLNDSSWLIFSDRLDLLCKKTLRKISEQPTGKKWTKVNERNAGNTLRNKYFSHRSSNWLAFETEISKIADNCFDYFKQVFGSLFDPGIESIKTVFGITIGDDLRSVLITRRIWLALWFRKGEINYIPSLFSTETPSIDIYLILNGEDIGDLGKKDASEWKRKLKNKVNTYTNSLCIRIEDLPFRGILPEEKVWLGSKGITIDRNNTDFTVYD